MNLWSYDADTQEFILNSRIDGHALCRIQPIEFAAANEIGRAADRLFEEGVQVGTTRLRKAVLDAVNGAEHF